MGASLRRRSFILLRLRWRKHPDMEYLTDCMNWQ